MVISKTQRKLIRVREQLKTLKEREKMLIQEAKLEDDAKRQSILDKHKISADELMKMIKEKEKEDRQILVQAEEGGIC